MTTASRPAPTNAAVLARHDELCATMGTLPKLAALEARVRADDAEGKRLLENLAHVALAMNRATQDFVRYGTAGENKAAMDEASALEIFMENYKSGADALETHLSRSS